MLAIAVLTAGLLRAVMEKWAPARRAGAHFSITARSSPAVSTAIASIRADAWTPIHYTNAVWDQAEKTHRAHAIIEQVHADLRSGPLAHLPSGSFAANSAWLVLAAIAFNLTRAAGCLASAFHAKATTGTIRAQLINIPARLARSARRLRMHLPQHWPWEQAWSQLFQATLAPPRPA